MSACISACARVFLCSRGDASVYFWNARAALAGPGCPEIDAVDGDVELVQRVATGKKPLATIVLSGKSQADAAVLDALLRSSGLPFWPFVNKHGVSMVALAADKRVADLVNVVNMERLYRQLGFPEIADDVLAGSSPSSLTCWREVTWSSNGSSDSGCSAWHMGESFAAVGSIALSFWSPPCPPCPARSLPCRRRCGNR
jgi:hypothetical protein